MRLAVTLGYDLTGAGDTASVRDKVLGARFDMEKRLSPELLFRAGSDVWLDVNELSQLTNNGNATTNVTDGASSISTSSSAGNPDQAIIPPRRDLAMGVWFDFVYKPHPRVEIVPGARFDYFGSSQDTAAPGTAGAGTVLYAGGSAGVPSFDPRLATRIRLHPKVTSVEQVAVSHQPPSFIVPVPGLAVGSLKSGLQSSYTLSQGFEIDLPEAITFTPTVFNQAYLGLTDFITSCEHGNGTDDCLDQRVRGRTIGLEVLVRRALTKRLTGLISYTLSRTTRDTNASQTVLDASKIPQGSTDIGAALAASQTQGRTGTILGDYDRTHVLNLIGAYDLGHGFRAGGRFVYYTGTPYSEKIGGVDVPPYNGYRLPDFFRFDVRFEKRWNLKKSAWVSLVLEWMNVSFQKEAASVTCSHVDGKLLDDCKPELIGPVTIPSLGVEGAL